MGIPDEKIDGTSLTADNGIFKGGALQDAPTLNDPMAGDKPDWEPEFLGQIDGIILVAGDSHETVEAKIRQVNGVFDTDSKPSIKVVKSIVGDVRPGDQDGHEQ